MPRYVVTATSARLVDEATVIVIVLVGTEQELSQVAIGLVIACSTFPQLLTAPALGALADRSRRPAHLLATCTAIGAVGLALTGAGLGTAPVAVSCATATLLAVAAPAIMGALSGIAARSARPRFEACDAFAYGAASIAAQGLVAASAAVAGASVTLAMLVIIAIGVVPLVATLPLQPAALASGARPGTLMAVRAIVRDRQLLSMTILTTLSMAAFGGAALTAVDLAEHRGHGAEAGSQLVLAMAVGAVAGAGLWTRLPPPSRPDRMAVASVVALTGALTLASAGSWLVCIVAFAIAGFADAPLLVATFATRNARSPDEVRATVYTISASLKLASSAIGAVAVGFVASTRPGHAAALMMAALQLTALGGYALARMERGVTSPSIAK